MYQNTHISAGESISTRYSLFKSASLSIVFLLLTPVALFISTFALIFVANEARTQKPAVLAAHTDQQKVGMNIFAALPDSIPSVEAIIGTNDARAEILREYLARYNSPLVPLADYIVQVADEQELDFRLITAIAQQESNLCKIIPEGSYNCWGWGIHSRGTLGFSSFEEGIRAVSEGIKREYINKGLTSPEEIMSKYTPLSNGSWALGVASFLEDMQ